MAEEELIYLNAFNLFEKFGGQRLKRISETFPSFKEAWFGQLFDFERTGIEKGIILEFFDWKNSIDPEKEFKKLERENIEILTIKDENYPRLLKEISLPPFLLYCKGELKPEESCFAIVGTRRCTGYGKQVAEELAADLINAGLTIVSGMARGIDTVAHKEAVKRSKRTIAVLGSGIDERSIYPSENLKLAREIVKSGGAVISEFPVGDKGLPHHFPQRNRIISGLSLGVLIVEAKMKSGAMITASWAADQGRDVFAVPGPINLPTSEGPNYLIKQGAKLTTDVNDILEELNLPLKSVEEKEIKAETPEEEKILEILQQEPLHIDKIIEKTKLNTNVVSSALLMMEVKGMVKNLGGNTYALSR